MGGNDETTDGDEQEWRPKRTEEYADGPVLTNRQAETVATLDTTKSREGTAALLGITASTVDDHRQDAQARVVTAIRQLQRLVGGSKTIRQAVENTFGPGEILIASDRTPDSTFPNLTSEELVEEVSPPEPEVPFPNRITLGGAARQRRQMGRWEAAFYEEFGNAERVEVIDSTTGERVDVGALIDRFPAKLETETIPVAELRDAEMLGHFVSDLRWTLSNMEKPFEFQRID